MIRELAHLFRSRTFRFILVVLGTVILTWGGQAAFSQTPLGQGRLINRQLACTEYLQRLATTNHESKDFAEVMEDRRSAERCLPKRPMQSAARSAPTEAFVNFETPHVHPLERTPDGNTLLAVNIGAHTLEVFNIVNGNLQQRASIPVGLDPVSVRARTNTEAWVVNQVSDSISIVDLSQNAVVRTLDTGNEPADVVFAGSPQKAFVSIAEKNQVLVYTLSNLAAAPQQIALKAEEPRAMAVSGDGSKVYVAAFESGNATTVMNGRLGPISTGAELGSNNVVSSSASPYGGVNPPPNNGSSFSPAKNPANPNQISSVIVRKNTQGQWLDDNNRNWTSFVSGANASQTRRVTGWDLPDRDVAIIDAQTLAVSYQTGLMNAVMALAVNPATQQVTVVGTEALNHIRFEPNLNSDFVRVHRATFTPGASATISDLNPHLNYSVPNIPQSERVQSIGDPRGIQWNQAGTRAYITGMGSNNLIVMGSQGERLGRVDVGEGPTGVVLLESSDRAFVLNKFDASISVISLSQLQEIDRKTMEDPTPAVIKAGRPFLYDTHLTSGLGQASCASCHIDGRTDRLAWDLGNPAGSVEGIHHPMKGPMLTQSLQDIMRFPNLHWRGDRATLANFNPTFTDLMGADRQLTSSEMQAFGDFLNTIHFVPNPYRNLDNSLPTSLVLPTGVTANPVNGRSSLNSCLPCHLNGRARSNVQSAELSQNIIPPAFHGFYKRFGYIHTSATDSTSGFGYFHDGVDPLLTAARSNDRLAAIMTFDGPDNGLTSAEERLDTHAAVGKQLTIQGTPTTAQTNVLNQFYSMVNTSPHVGMVVRVTQDGTPTGYYYLGNNTFQTEDPAQTIVRSQLESLSSAGTPVTYMIVVKGTEPKIFNAGQVFETSNGNWEFCANEGQTCNFSGTRTVRYGANGQYSVRSLTNGTACNNSVFGDPIPGVLKQCELDASTTTAEWQFCANEGQNCVFSGTQPVRYGANGQFTTLTLSDGTVCNNTVFGDPIPGVQKQCEIPVQTNENWTFCAQEGGVCPFTGTRSVRYGANGQYSTLNLTDGTACNNIVFGDPIPGVRKSCELATTQTTTWTACAQENQTCSFLGTKAVRYGANDQYATQIFTDGTECSNAVFGDPVPGVRKQCDYGDP